MSFSLAACPPALPDMRWPPLGHDGGREVDGELMHVGECPGRRGPVGARLARQFRVTSRAGRPVVSRSARRRRKQVAGRQAAVGPPFLGDGEDLLLGGEVVGLIGGLDGFTERKVARQHDVFPLSAMMRAPCTVQGPIPGIAVSSAMSSSSGRLLSTSGSSRPSDSRSARSRSVPIFRHESPASRSLSGSTPSNSAGEGDGRRTGPRSGPGSGGSLGRKLLPGDLEQQGTVEIHRRQLGHPRPGIEVRPLIDEPRQHGVGVAKVGARLLQPRGAAGIVGHGARSLHRRACLSQLHACGPNETWLSTSTMSGCPFLRLDCRRGRGRRPSRLRVHSIEPMAAPTQWSRPSLAVDPDRVRAGWSMKPWSGAAGEPASPGSGDRGLARAAGGQQPQLAGALHGRGAVAGLELGVDAADVRVDGVHRDRQLACDLGPGEVRREIPQHPELARAECSVCGAAGWSLAAKEEPCTTSRMSVSSAACAVSCRGSASSSSREPVIANGRTSRSGSARASARSAAWLAARWSPSSRWASPASR